MPPIREAAVSSVRHAEYEGLLGELFDGSWRFCVENDQRHVRQGLPRCQILLRKHAVCQQGLDALERESHAEYFLHGCTTQDCLYGCQSYRLFCGLFHDEEKVFVPQTLA